MNELSEEELEEAADDLLGAADYLKTALDDGDEIYESKWLGATMQAHGLMRDALAEIRRLRAALAERDARVDALEGLLRTGRLTGTLKYLRTQALNGTLTPQVVIQNVDNILGIVDGRAASLASELKEKQP